MANKTFIVKFVPAGSNQRQRSIVKTTTESKCYSYVVEKYGYPSHYESTDITNVKVKVEDSTPITLAKFVAINNEPGDIVTENPQLIDELATMQPGEQMFIGLSKVTRL